MTPAVLGAVMMNKNALILAINDNTATVLGDIRTGDELNVYDAAGALKDSLRSSSDIPRGHKIALSDIEPGKNVIKYGYPIGRASCRIKRGEHVHVHNLESSRGRGDIV